MLQTALNPKFASLNTVAVLMQGRLSINCCESCSLCWSDRAAVIMACWPVPDPVTLLGTLKLLCI